MYVDIEYCDSVLSSQCWISADDTQKQRAIDMGELWIDSDYVCGTDSDSVKHANALLADMYVNSSMFTPQDPTIESKKVKAGSVTTEKSYFQQDISNPQFSEVNLLLSSACSVNTSGGSAFNVVRV